jgi:hypothetical protein
MRWRFDSAYPLDKLILAFMPKLIYSGKRNRTGKGENGSFLLLRKVHENPKVFVGGAEGDDVRFPHRLTIYTAG